VGGDGYAEMTVKRGKTREFGHKPLPVSLYPVRIPGNILSRRVNIYFSRGILFHEPNLVYLLFKY
jgi:hypothetical protein